MPKYIFESSETVYYMNTIEAESLEEAKKVFYDGYIDFKPADYGNWQLDNYYEEGTNY